MDNGEIYDVKNYSDEELYEILDINNPTDRELEMSIINNMEKHERGSKLYVFFKEMYKHFFDIDDLSSDEENEVEGFETSSQPTTGRIANITKKDGTPSLAPTDMNASDVEAKANAGNAINVKDATGANIKGNVTINTKPQEIYNVDYTKGKLNPIKRETMWKMISIDSRYRENPNSTSATDFTMNLSTSIENLVSIKLYTIQIPYTWYMVNSGYGTNYFYIKGNSPGINNGNHDIKVEIGSGNYSSTDFVTTINTRLAQLAALPENADISFGQTQMYYNAANAKTRFVIDINSTYTDADYRMFFPYWTTPNVVGEAKSNSIPSFFGFNFDNYYPYVVYGKRNLYLTANESTNNSQSAYWLDASNNYFTVIQYRGPSNYVNGQSTILKQFNIEINQTFGLNYNRQDLYSYLNASIQQSQYLDSTYSNIFKVNATDSSLIWTNYTHFELNVKLNRKTTVNLENTKIAVIFPDETYLLSTNRGLPIWTGDNSCFGFINKTNELCEILSETPSLVTNYNVKLNENIIQLTLKKTGFDLSINQIKIPIPQGIYLLNELQTVINNAIISYNNTTTNISSNGIFNINTSVSPPIQNTFFGIINDVATFQFDIAKIFDQSSYIVDLSASILSSDLFGFDASYVNLTSSNYTINKTVPIISQVSVLPGDRIVLYPKPNTGIVNQSTVTLYLNSTNDTITYNSIGDFFLSMNQLFLNLIDPETTRPLMNLSYLSYRNSNTQGNIDITFNIVIQKTFTEEDYQLDLIHENLTGGNNIWSDLLFNSTPYLLIQDISSIGHSIITGNNTVFQNNIQIKEGQNTIVFKPYIDGVADTTGYNDIVLTIPVKSTTYIRSELITAINTALSENPLTTGSQLSIVQNGANEYAKFRMNINKTYKPRDYKLVFYDTVSFSYCGVGTSGGRSIRTGTWESTLGWMFGFHNFTEYKLVDFYNITADNISGNELFDENYYNNLYTSLPGTGEGFVNSYNPTNGQICVIADSVMTTDIYNYFMIILDDFVQNHVNDGLITITSLENDLSLPTYASRVTYQCDPITGQKVAVSASNKERMNLSSKQLYAMNEIMEAKKIKQIGTSNGPVFKDVFAIIPLKLTGLQFGKSYLENGGTLQNQDRKYFGPVRLQKISVKLLNDKGDVVILNGGDWSFTILCEILVNKPS